MSFPKAKIKRFNDIPAINSPVQEKKEKSKLFGGLIGKDDNKCQEKLSLFEKLTAKSMSTAEKDAKNSKYRLFRTPSLPRRLKFRPTSDSTPSKSSLKAAAEAANNIRIELEAKKNEENETAVNVAFAELQSKTETIKECATLIETYKMKIEELNGIILKNNIEKNTVIDQKDSIILHLEREIESINKADELIKNIAEKALDKINTLNSEIDQISKDNELKSCVLIEQKNDLEQKSENLAVEITKLKNENLEFYNQNQQLINEVNFLKFTIFEQKNEMEDFKIRIRSLVDENVRISQSLDLVRRRADDDMISFEQNKNELTCKIEHYKVLNSELTNEVHAERQTIKQINVDLKDVSCSLKNLIQKHEKEILDIKDNFKIKIEEIETIHLLEKSKLTMEHNKILSDLNKKHLIEVEHINELTEEKIRISEVQFEEKIKAIEISTQQRVDQEKKLWKGELEKCQKIAEKEIIQTEYEKNDLKDLLDITNELVRDKEVKIERLENWIKINIENESKLHDSCQIDLENLRRECDRIMAEKYNYQLTLKNTRSTVNILMDRLQKSDTDVETLKADLETMTASKKELDKNYQKLKEELIIIKDELEEYKVGLSALRQSSSLLEHELRQQENIFEKSLKSEEETLQTVDQIGKLLTLKVEENISKYFKLYNDLKKKYESREIYIKDMKTLLDEFVTGIEIARIEIESKNEKLLILEQENKSIKLENMTLKFKCEQFEKYDHTINETRIHTNTPIIMENSEKDFVTYDAEIDSFIINYMNKEENEEKQLNKENKQLKNRIELLEDKLKLSENFAKEASEKYAELIGIHSAPGTPKQKEIQIFEETKNQLKNILVESTIINEKQENEIKDLNEKIFKISNKTPNKTKLVQNQQCTSRSPRTPKSKTPIKSLFGKENRSPAVGVGSPVNVLRARNN